MYYFIPSNIFFNWNGAMKVLEQKKRSENFGKCMKQFMPENYRIFFGILN